MSRTAALRPSRLVSALALTAAITIFAAAAVADELPFVRVNVAAAAFQDLPLGGQRYVPMPLADFDDLVARLGAAARGVRQPVAVAARYQLTLDAAGVVTGRVEFELDGGSDAVPAEVSLGRVVAERCTVQTGDGMGEAAVFCLADGTVAVRTTGPATYAAELRLPGPPVGGRFSLPLVPALVTTLELRLPRPLRPIAVGGTAAVVEPASPDGLAWRIVRGPVGPGGELTVVLWDGRGEPPLVRSWSRVTIRGRQAEVVARLEPMAGWTPQPLDLELPAEMRLIRAVAADGSDLSGRLAEARPRLEIPSRLVGSLEPLLVTGMLPLDLTGSAAVPTIRPVADRWAGTNVLATVDPSLAIQRVQLRQCRASSPAAAATWPVPVVPLPPTAAGIEPAELYLEYQTPAGEAAVVIGPRDASFDVARVTTVDISPGTVLGRAAVDVRVVAGRVFGMTAEVAPGWFIDTVEAVDWQRGGAADGGLAVPGAAPEWRVVRSPRGSELRIGLPLAATPRRSPGLRITGHRAGLPLGAGFSSDDMDMVRFPGETALLEFQVGPTAVLEAVGGELNVEPLPASLAPLSGLAAARARIRAGERAPAVRCRLVRRRPPVEADVRVGLLVRDDRLAETFTFTCRPVAGELDAVVVHFSEPMGPELEWSLAAGASGTLAAQRLDPGDATRGELRTEPSVAESWLIELRPATTTAVTFRGSRTLPLSAAAAVPLAWVEAAERPGGTVTIQSDSGRLPEVTNRQLRELPPSVDTAAGVVELAYGPPGPLAEDGPAAEVAPSANTAAARAWAWRQATICWCHDSGRIEWESRFEIENQGRETATLTLADGLRVEGVTVAGEAVSAAAIGPGAGGLAVPLPRTGSRLRLVVRGSGGRLERLGWWRVGGLGCGIDMPVLDRELTVMVPPGLAIAGAVGAAGERDWATRLFGSGISPPASPAAMERGFTPVAVAGGAAVGESEIVLIRRRFVASLTIVVACLSVAASAWLARRHALASLAVCGTAAVAALWVASPWDGLARGALWAAVVGTWAGGWRRSGRGTLTTGIIGLSLTGLVTAPAVADEPPLRVYVTGEGAEGTALVPEPLLRRLSAAAAGPPTLRVLAEDVGVEPDRGVWRVRLDLDADRGGAIVLEQGADAVWQPPADPPRGLAVILGDDGRTARIQASVAGRHQLTLDLVPTLSRVGDLDVATIRLPPAPRGTLRLVPADATVPVNVWQCDRAVGPGPWLPAPFAADRWDIAAADRVRLVRSADPGAVIPAAVRAAVSFNDIAWRDDGCRVTATFDVGSDSEIVRRLAVRVARGLEPAAGREPVATSLGNDRYLLELPEPRAGQRRIVTTFRMPVGDPVGVFEAPFVWLESADTDVRTVRLRPAADLEADVRLPPTSSLVRPRDEDGLETAAVWRSDVGGSGAEADGPGPRIEVRRRLWEPGVTQDLAIDFADDHVGLRLRCRLDAATEPLLEIPIDLPPAAIVDRVSLARQPSAEPGRGSASEPSAAAPVPTERIDLVWSRESADRIVAVVQRPDVGRFQMQFDARLPIRPASRGRLPVARLAAADLPLEVSWRAAAGMGLQVTPAESATALPGARMELGPGAAGPVYELSRAVPTESESKEPGVPVDSVAGEFRGDPFTSVDLHVDGQGRGWGLVRFDLVTRERVVTLVLPAGMRLFDVRADGRELPVRPAAGNAWEVRLHDVGWPRSLVAVFAGPLGSRLADGQAVRLEPPRLAGFPTGRVIWSLAIPQGLAIRVSEPARILDPSEVEGVWEEEQQRFDQAFRLAVRQSAGSLRERLDAFAASRRATGSPAGERSWYESVRAGDESNLTRTPIKPDADGTVTIRAVPADREVASGRGLATAVLLALGLACWTAARRFPDRCRQAAGPIRRWWWVGCGVIWMMASDTMLPGGLMLAIGLWLALPRRPPPIPPANEPAAAIAGRETTLSYVPK
jgi:hypothetical protein